MDKNSFEERRQALEEAFFNKEDARLLDRMRQNATRDTLASASGISDSKVIDSLLKAGLTPSTLASLSLAPMIFVAWADRMMDDRERQAVLSAAAEAGIGAGSDALHLVEQWLAERPPAALFEAWRQSVGATMKSLDRAAAEDLRNTCVSRAKKVAQATGGFLGISAVSAVERETIAAIESAFA